MRAAASPISSAAGSNRFRAAPSTVKSATRSLPGIERHHLRQQRFPAPVPSSRASAAGGSSSGSSRGGVAERPTLLPGVSDVTAKSRQRPRPYRVLLHNDDVNRREYVVQVLLKVIDGMTVDVAVNCMQDAHANGFAVVVAGVEQPEAERMCEGLRSCGLSSTIEPVGGKGGGGGGEGGDGGGGAGTE